MGVITNEKDAVLYLKSMLKKVIKKNLIFNNEVHAMVIVPCGISKEQKSVFKNVFFASGISKIDFVPSAIATKLGYMNLENKDACITIDVGGGKTDIAFVSGDRVIASMTLGIGGKIMDLAVINYVERSNKMRISLVQAERLKTEIGSLYPGDRADMEVTGVEIFERKLITEILTASDVNDAVGDFYREIAEQVENLLKGISGDITNDILSNGIFLSGAGSKIVGFDVMLKNILAMPVTLANDLEFVAIKGCLKLLN